MFKVKYVQSEILNTSNRGKVVNMKHSHVRSNDDKCKAYSRISDESNPDLLTGSYIDDKSFTGSPNITNVFESIDDCNMSPTILTIQEPPVFCGLNLDGILHSLSNLVSDYSENVQKFDEEIQIC